MSLRSWSRSPLMKQELSISESTQKTNNCSRLYFAEAARSSEAACSGSVIAQRCESSSTTGPCLKNSSELPKVILHPEIQIKSTYCSRPRQVVFCSTDSWYLYPPLLLWGAQLLWSCLHSMPISHQTSALMFTFEKQRNVVHHCKGGTPVVVDCIYICSASQ